MTRVTRASRGSETRYVIDAGLGHCGCGYGTKAQAELCTRAVRVYSGDCWYDGPRGAELKCACFRFGEESLKVEDEERLVSLIIPVWYFKHLVSSSLSS